MGADTKIQWTDRTFNPWIGCSKVSEGCKHCYAEAQTKRMPNLVHGSTSAKDKALPVWGDHAPRRRTSAANWQEPLRWNRQAEKDGARLRVFCASMADVFEDRRELDAYRVDLWHLIERTPHLDWQLLTKRPENILRMVPAHWCGRGFPDVLMDSKWPRNAWIGCTIENQEQAEERIPHLLQVPAAVRFVSYEPALGPVRFDDLIVNDGRPGEWHVDCLSSDDLGPEDDEEFGGRSIDWVIVGGESGPGARPFDLAWARQTIAQCKAAGVACFVKQMGARPVWGNGDSPGQPGQGRIACLKEPADLCHTPKWCVEAGHCKSGAGLTSKGGNPDEWPEDLRVREFPFHRPMN